MDKEKLIKDLNIRYIERVQDVWVVATYKKQYCHRRLKGALENARQDSLRGHNLILINNNK